MQWKHESTANATTLVASTELGDFVVSKTTYTKAQLTNPTVPGYTLHESVEAALHCAQEFYSSYMARQHGAQRFSWKKSEQYGEGNPAVCTATPLGVVQIVKSGSEFQVLWPWLDQRCVLEVSTLEDALKEVEAGYVYFVKTEAESLGLSQSCSAPATPVSAPEVEVESDQAKPEPTTEPETPVRKPEAEAVPVKASPEPELKPELKPALEPVAPFDIIPQASDAGNRPLPAMLHEMRNVRGSDCPELANHVKLELKNTYRTAMLNGRLSKIKGIYLPDSLLCTLIDTIRRSEWQLVKGLTPIAAVIADTYTLLFSYGQQAQDALRKLEYGSGDRSFAPEELGQEMYDNLCLRGFAGAWSSGRVAITIQGMCAQLIAPLLLQYVSVVKRINESLHANEEYRSVEDTIRDTLEPNMLWDDTMVEDAAEIPYADFDGGRKRTDSGFRYDGYIYLYVPERKQAGRKGYPIRVYLFWNPPLIKAMS